MNNSRAAWQYPAINLDTAGSFFPFAAIDIVRSPPNPPKADTITIEFKIGGEPNPEGMTLPGQIIEQP